MPETTTPPFRPVSTTWKLAGCIQRKKLTFTGEKHSIDEGLKWYDSVYQQLDELLPFPESHGLAVENDSFPYELKEKLVGGKKRTYRAILTIVGSEIRVLTVRRAAQSAITPDDV